jgi:hypothetical protein
MNALLVQNHQHRLSISCGLLATNVSGLHTYVVITHGWGIWSGSGLIDQENPNLDLYFFTGDSPGQPSPGEFASPGELPLLGPTVGSYSLADPTCSPSGGPGSRRRPRAEIGTANKPNTCSAAVFTGDPDSEGVENMCFTLFLFLVCAIVHST